MRGIEGIDEALSRLRRMLTLSCVTNKLMFELFNVKHASAIKVAEFAHILVHNVKLGIGDELAKEVAHKVRIRATSLVPSGGAGTAGAQHAATQCNLLQHSATCCSTVQPFATQCNLLQHSTALNSSRPCLAD